MKHVLALLLFTAASLVPAPASAQVQPQDLYVSVVDRNGAPVSDLTASDFNVREDGVAREVLRIKPATAPMQVALLLDNSQVASSAIQLMRDGAEAFVESLAGKAEIAVVTFGERPTIMVDYTTDTAKLKAGVDRLFARPGSGAYLLDALVNVSEGLQKREADRPVIVVVMTEGIEFSNQHYDRVLDKIKASGAALHVLAIGQPSGSLSDEIRNRNQVISRGTSETGGRRDQLLATTAIEPKLKQLADELTHQYLVTYARPEALIPPKKIEVTVDKPGLTARARTVPTEPR
ncbi:MAG TPA: VWA domain-containing protein [Gemmatimonadaceae bacterium]|nr:VWA domain-containing protein [Vicinamibacterales bacterium]